MEPPLNDRRQGPAGVPASGVGPSSGVGAASGASAAGGGCSGAETHRLCLWLAEQAACDRGLVGRLVKVHGGFAAVVAQPRSALAGALRDAPVPDRPGGPAAGQTPAAHEAVVAWCDDDYPAGLRELFDPPPALYLRGRRWQTMLRALRARPTVAIVGARRPSPYGLEMAWLLGSGLARAGVNVVSGMALGIDAQAHVGALEGLGTPAADDTDDRVPVVLAGVLGAGVRLAVPRTNEELFGAVERRGLLLSEYGWTLPPQPWRFPARNRLIAALSDAVVMVEGRGTSGALHTAAFALDLGRDVLAVPGEAGRPLSAGPHKLLRDGAHLCESPDDVLALLPARSWSIPGERDGRSGGPASRGVPDADEDRPPRDVACDPGGVRSEPERRVLATLRRGQHTADQIGLSLGLSAGEVSAALSMLEIDGLLDVQAGGRYRLRRDARRRSPR